MMHGAEGIKECANISVLNNNYLRKMLLTIPGLSESFAGNGITRQEQIRYTWEKLYKDTGIGTEGVDNRIVDFGIPWYWTSHHPWVIPEPMTLEPCETYSKEDLEEYYQVLKLIAEEAYKNPQIIKDSPHKSVTHKRNNEASLDDPNQWATTWRAYLRKHVKE
jgi:glycine dehydrogenase subunit 2